MKGSMGPLKHEQKFAGRKRSWNSRVRVNKMCKSQGDKKLWYLEDSENSCTADQEIGWGQVVKDFIHYSRELGLYPEGKDQPMKG